MTRNAITDVPGLKVGHAEDKRIASGVTAVVFDRPCIASVAIGGGAPGERDTALLEPERTVERVDAIVLSGGSAFGLDAMGGAMALLRGQGRGLEVGAARVPIVPGAILFDLLNGGDKAWGQAPVYWHLGHRAAWLAGLDVAQGSVGAGLGATTANLKGGLGTASVVTSGGFVVGALVAVNAIGTATVGDGPHFWAAPYERDNEFGGRGFPASVPAAALVPSIKGGGPRNTTLAIVATDAALTKPEAKRVALMAQDGFARALRPSHAAMDGDIVFAAATGGAARAATDFDRLEIGALAADCVARAIARGVYEAEPLPFPGALPSWKGRFG
ncbi:putative enzyme [Beijerinckiaceae bacterium RH AL1]|nr:P1 family peptidase [Beijerinckiaceae bacterium]VVB47342.1 putative enzyme [Beijerinckiaceae bacterium RH CH11]VVB47425.1 putative enzyme [Beijerinckiaceae bacterium RH AL8]VVC55839.1 putative enzyme [Beijerinckiaceae bacterium RH AL1]